MKIAPFLQPPSGLQQKEEKRVKEAKELILDARHLAEARLFGRPLSTAMKCRHTRFKHKDNEQQNTPACNRPAALAH